MPDINFNGRIELYIDILEPDDNAQIFKLNIQLRLTSFDENIAIDRKIWIEYYVFDLFLLNMRRGLASILQSLDNKFSIELSSTDSPNEIVICMERETIENIDYIFKIKTPLSHDEFSRFQQAFYDFPKWW